MSTILMFIVLIITGIYWVYDSVAWAPSRKKENKEEPVVTSYARGIFLILAIVLIIKYLSVDILTLLVILTLGSLIIWLIDKFFFAKIREVHKKKDPLLVDYAKSLFPIFLIVLIIRSFIIQPFRVPTGSLEPTVMPNDFVAVSQFSYGLRLPVINKKVLGISEPKHGDIVVFRYPVDPSIDFVKRVVGLPGDHVVYKDKVLTINGKEMTQTFVSDGFDVEPEGNIASKIMQENLYGVKHNILVHDEGGEATDFDVTVPAGYYFMMGDNRDNSADSRVWGFVPERNLIGKAFMIWLSWDHGIRWSRMGSWL